MHNDRALIHAALLWHAAHVRRMAIGTARRQLEKEAKANGGTLISPSYLRQAEAAHQLTEAKRKELATLRNLAKACANQRGHFDQVDIIDLVAETRLVPFSEDDQQPESRTK